MFCFPIKKSGMSIPKPLLETPCLAEQQDLAHIGDGLWQQNLGWSVCAGIV